MPIIGKNEKFEGALCADIEPVNDLSDFYSDEKEEEKSKYMIYTPDSEKWIKDWRLTNLVTDTNKLIFDGNYTKDCYEFDIQDDDKAMLFDEKNITWGNMWISNKTGCGKNEPTYGYIFIVTDMTIKFPNLDLQVKDPTNENVFCKDKDYCEKKYKLLFFKNADKLYESMSKYRSDLRYYVLKMFLIFLGVFLFPFSVAMTFLLIKLTNAITRPVIELYELIKHIIEQKKIDKTQLSFKATNKELNNLHKTFNQIVKTMQIAKVTSGTGQDARAV